MPTDETFEIFPIGTIRKRGRSASLVVRDRFSDALLGLDGFSHVIILCWFQASDTMERRSTLQVHPRRDKENPLTGVFATRSPRRPNPIAVFVSRVHGVKGNRIQIDPIDAFDGTPVLDIKPYIPESDSIPDAAVPWWVKRRKAQRAWRKSRVLAQRCRGAKKKESEPD